MIEYTVGQNIAPIRGSRLFNSILGLPCNGNSMRGSRASAKAAPLQSLQRLAPPDQESQTKPVAAIALPTYHQSPIRFAPYHPRIQANMRGATIVASDSIMYLGVSSDSLPQVIFSFGTAPE